MEQTKPYRPIPKAQLDLTVANVLIDNLKWNAKKIEKILSRFSKEIQCFKLSQMGVEDIYIWQPTNTWIYSTKSGYATASLNKSTIQTQSIEDFQWIKDVWNSECSLKMRVFIWSIIQRALPPGENLQSRRIQDQVLWMRCKEKETATHLFFQCQFAK